MGAAGAVAAATIISTGYMVYSQQEAARKAEKLQKAEMARQDAISKRLQQQGPAPQIQSPSDIGERKRDKLDALRQGLQSTIKTKGGLVSANVVNPSAGTKTTLGA